MKQNRNLFYKSSLLILVFFTNNISSFAQNLFTVTINIRNNANTNHTGEQFYITGNFNNWLPKQILVGEFPAVNESKQVVIENVKAGLFEFKFTRGDWKTLASTTKGNLEGPLKTIISQDTTLNATVDGWRDDFPASTLSPQVHVLDSAFYLPELDVNRRVWIYLPKDYANSKKRYPVLYMHDGQDLFDEATSKGRIGPLEWSVDETIDASSHDAIVVAIAHAEDIKQRQDEYFIKPNINFPNPKGEQYLASIVNTLKPYVDKNYRTLPDKKHTAMAGSSVGGLLTFYAGLLYPETFANLGILSPSIWLDEGNIANTIHNVQDKKSIKKQAYYFYGGGNESRIKPDSSVVKMHSDIRLITSELEKNIHPTIEISINPEGRHGAWYWQKAFPEFFEWWQKRI
ncbi:alpha/beta hydrolase [Sphingobacterium hungaricum]|uniref:alpha/beta hydrolase n=1 Tax=Sphingobacterium hungaricum TaxID=2082723 RepID=UPI001E5B3AF0|nr:alpha/beta hydrolase-fold protein [Sphingobacterium hungaricum]